jgi:hypothetical protein
MTANCSSSTVMRCASSAADRRWRMRDASANLAVLLAQLPRGMGWPAALLLPAYAAGSRPCPALTWRPCTNRSRGSEPGAAGPSGKTVRDCTCFAVERSALASAPCAREEAEPLASVLASPDAPSALARSRSRTVAPALWRAVVVNARPLLIKRYNLKKLRPRAGSRVASEPRLAFLARSAPVAVLRHPDAGTAGADRGAPAGRCADVPGWSANTARARICCAICLPIARTTG